MRRVRSSFSQGRGRRRGTGRRLSPLNLDGRTNSGRNTPTSPVSAFTSTSLPERPESALSEPNTSTTEPASAGGSSSSRSATPAGSMSDGGVSLETLFEVCRETAQVVRVMNTKLCCVEDKTRTLTSSLKELNDYVKKYCRNSFVIKGSQYEGQIKNEMAKLFLFDVKRRPSDSSVKAALVRVVGPDIVRDRTKFDTAYTYAKNKLTEYRTEERRKVLGVVPYENACYLDTTGLSQLIISCMLPTEDLNEENTSL